METSRVIRDWLSEYKALSDQEIHTYANTILHNESLIAALYQLFEEDIQQEMVDPVCHQLFEFYRSGRPQLQRFTLQLVPTLIWAYLSAISKTEKRKVGGIEVCLLGIYNLEIVNKDGTPKVRQYTIPTLAVPSIYHEPPTLATLALTESALLRYHSDEPVVIVTKPLPQTESLNAQNRLTVLTYVLSCYNEDIANLSSRSHAKLCKMASRLAKTGFDNVLSGDIERVEGREAGGAPPSRGRVKFFDEPRITTSSGILVEMLTGIYFAMFNGQARDGMQALNDIHSRASYELFADVILVTNAIKNSLLYNPSGQPKDGPMGISVALSPTNPSPANSFAKRAITNASFRAKKLPDDIPVILEDETPAIESLHRENSLHEKSEEKTSSKKSEEKTSSKAEEKQRKSDKRKLKKVNSKDKDKPEDIDVPDAEGELPPKYEEIVEGDAVVATTSSDKSKFNITNPIKSIMKKEKHKVTRRESDVKKGKDSRDRDSGGSPRHSAVFPASWRRVVSHVPRIKMRIKNAFSDSASIGAEMTDLNQIQVSVVRSSSAQRSIVDSVAVRPQSIDTDSQHRRTSSFPENMSAGSEAVGPDGKGIVLSSHTRGESNSSSNSDVHNTHF